MAKPKAPKYTPASDINLKADLENAAKENETAYADMETICGTYNDALLAGTEIIDDVTNLVNSIANHPKKFDEQIEKIQAIKIEHLTIEQFKTAERKALVEGGLLAGALAAVGAAFAVFGKAKSKGIIGAMVALLGVLFGGLFSFFKKRKAKKQAIEAINKLYEDTFSLQQNHAKVLALLQQIQPAAINLKALLAECEQYRGLDRLSFLPMSEDRKKLSQLVTNTASFAKLLSQKVV